MLLVIGGTSEALDMNSWLYCIKKLRVWCKKEDTLKRKKESDLVRRKCTKREKLTENTQNLHIYIFLS